MYRIALLSVLTALCSAQATKDKVDAKIIKLGVTFFNKAEVAKVTSCLEDDFYKLPNMMAIKDAAMPCVFAACPMTKYLPALSMLGDMDKCVKPEDTMSLVDRVFPLAKAKVQKLYQAIKAAIKKPKDNGKPKKQCLEKGYVKIQAALTKKFVADVATKLCPGLNRKEWNCVLDKGAKVVDLNLYPDVLKKCEKLVKP